ncbi:MAG: galactokinase [Nanoarchaeota archaeon]
MIITRTPLRISLGGGGTDLKSYYKDYGSFFISAAINKYVYITLHETFSEGYIVKYSQIENTSRISQIQNGIVRESFRLHNMPNKIELNSIADIPYGTGLGSSGSFGVGLLKAVYSSKKEQISQQNLAEEAYKIEADILKRPIGKQDQYIASFGGITCFEIDKNGKVSVSPLNIPKETLHELEDNLVLFFTGYTRNAANILKEQDQKSKQSENNMINNLHFVKKLGLESKQALETGDLDRFAEIMNIHWQEKKKRSGAMSNPRINELYDIALDNGALGGKIIGAGGGGFLMFLAHDKQKLVKRMREEGLIETRFGFDFEGPKVLIQD